MTVISTQRISEGSNGTLQFSSANSYTSTYLVEVDNVNDGPDTIVAGAAIPGLGVEYSEGTDNDSSAILLSKTHTRLPGNRNLWRVVCNYGPRGENKLFRTKTLAATANPIDAMPIVSAQAITRQQTVRDAVLRTPMPNRNVGNKYPVSSSAGEDMTPRPTRNFPVTAIRIRRNMTSYSLHAAEMVGSVNNATFFLDHHGLTGGFSPAEVQITQFGGRQMIVNDTIFWENEVEIHVNTDGWRLRVVDAGMHELIAEGDNNGAGGVYAAADLPAGQPSWRRFKVDGKEIPGPVLLDGNGKRLPDGADPVVTEWSIYDEVDFAALHFMWIA